MPAKPRTNAPAGLSEQYDKAYDAQRNHKLIAGALIKQALDILQSNKAKLSVEDLMKATAALDRGTKMETRADSEMIKLTKERPR